MRRPERRRHGRRQINRWHLAARNAAVFASIYNGRIAWLDGPSFAGLEG